MKKSESMYVLIEDKFDYIIDEWIPMIKGYCNDKQTADDWYLKNPCDRDYKKIEKIDTEEDRC